MEHAYGPSLTAVCFLQVPAEGEHRTMEQELTQLLVRDAHIPSGDATLSGDLVVPSAATGIVLFAHGSGSSRHSSRNRFVASVLQRAGLGTLLFDLLTRAEEDIDQ